MVTHQIRNSKPSEKDWKVTSITVVTMEHIVGRVLYNQSSVEEWLLLKAIIDLVKIYVDSVRDEVQRFWQQGITLMRCSTL